MTQVLIVDDREDERNQLKLKLEASGYRVILAIEDDGTGFDLLQPRERGQGLRNSAARARALSAQLDIRSSRGEGTRIVVDIPLEPEHVAG